ncbi:membrane protein [Xenorhabdus thuongxuanensis]|uniref:Membrane protein n=1 Tax=Xenorhabdus thuongxuanensis TaxID=1873484 RepID=A0A1Q5U7K9_9GAMM|nr:membrane protein [Xenorhabdus thuongxuanensis]
MKKILLTGALFFALSPFVVQAQDSQKVTCESLKEEIAQKIIKNGVSQTDFSLDLVPSDKVTENNTTNGKIVGYCDHGKQKIVYVRLSHTDTAPTEIQSDKKGQE